MAKKAIKTTFNDPLSVEREYMRVLRGFVRECRKVAVDGFLVNFDNIVAQYKQETQQDSAMDLIAHVFEIILRAMDSKTSTPIGQLDKLASAADKWNDKEFKKIIKANLGLLVPESVDYGLGVDVFRNEPFLKPLTKAWIKENTDLIKSIPTKLNPEIERIVRRGVIDGLTVREIQTRIQDRFNVADSRAQLIAQDQVLKFNADLVEHRLKSVGVKKYIWRTVGDMRVRKTHMDRSGNTYTWDDSPKPGQEVRCRCRAEAIFEDK